LSLLARVRRFIARHHLAERDTRVVVALSGGSDSVALAHLVRELDAAGALRAAGLVHLNHQLRESAGRDEQFSVRLAESFGWRIVVEHADVAARARLDRRSVEAAARTARYQCFDRARSTLGADVVALAHTRDDQAETVLLRLLRGAGPTGLAGMHPRNGPIIRPVLSCRRHELRAFLAARRIEYVEDETNADVSIPRNRVRAELLPLLETRFNPAIVDVLADEAELARGTWLWLEESLSARAWMAEPASDQLTSEIGAGWAPDNRDGEAGLTTEAGSTRQKPALEPGAGMADLTLDVAALRQAPLALKRFVLWRAMRMVAGRRLVSFTHVQAVLESLESAARGPIDMPGQTVQRLDSRLVLSRRPDGGLRRGQDTSPNLFDYPLSIPGQVAVPEGDCVLVAEPFPAGTVNLETVRATSGAAIVRLDMYGGEWRVRNRRPGDRFHPVGLGGQKKLQDFFVDRKVPRLRRDHVPLVVDQRDRIVWVAGFGVDEAFRVTDATQGVIMLRLKTLGGSA
jgi:tRNA(Ile)-lysidine synthase